MQCYTYLIGWSKEKKYYYGCQYKKGCKPEDLWTIYFTSSKEVAKCREMFGEPDIIQIRKIFGDNVLATRLWEMKVIRRIKAAKRKDFLNLRNPGGLTEKWITGEGRIPWNKGKIGVQQNKFKGITGRYTEEQLIKISNNTKAAMENMDTSKCANDAAENTRWMNKNGKHKRAKPNQIEQLINEGWCEGRIMKRNIEGKFI
jgi:hypothetical protein